MADAKCVWQCPEDWYEWSRWLAAGLHARNRWRLPVLLVGILFAHGRRTVTTWLRAAGVSDDFQDYYYFLAALGCKTKSVATQLLLLVLRTLPLPDRLLVVIDDTPTKRYGPKVEGADIHRNPTPGPADQKYLYGHIWVTLSLAVRHPRFGPLALPLLAMLYVRRKTMAKIPKWRGWTFATKLVLAARLVEWIAPIVKQAGKTLWVVVDGGYVKAPFLKRALRAGVTIIGRLRKDAALPRPAAKVAAWPAARSWPSAEVRQEQDQLGQACRPSQRLGDGPMHRLRQDGHEALQDLLGDLPAGRRTDSRGDCRGGPRLVPVFFYRSERNGRGDYRSLCRPGDDRAGLPRCEGSLWRGPAAGAEHLVQLGRLPFESLDSYAGGTLVLEPSPRRALRSQPVAVGRRRSASVPCRSPQSLAATHHGTRIIDACRRPAAATKNPPTDQASYDLGRIR